MGVRIGKSEKRTKESAPCEMTTTQGTPSCLITSCATLVCREQRQAVSSFGSSGEEARGEDEKKKHLAARATSCDSDDIRLSDLTVYGCSLDQHTGGKKRRGRETDPCRTTASDCGVFGQRTSSGAVKSGGTHPASVRIVFFGRLRLR